MNYAEQNRKEKRERKEVTRKRIRAAFRHAYQQDPNSDFATIKAKVIVEQSNRIQAAELREEQHMLAASCRFFNKIRQGKIKSDFAKQFRSILQRADANAVV